MKTFSKITKTFIIALTSQFTLKQQKYKIYLNMFTLLGVSNFGASPIQTLLSEQSHLAAQARQQRIEYSLNKNKKRTSF